MKPAQNDALKTEFRIINDLVLRYLKEVDPENSYFSQTNYTSIIFLNYKDKETLDKLDYHSQRNHAAVHIQWNSSHSFPVITKDQFQKLNKEKLIETISQALSSMNTLKGLFKPA